MMEYYYKYNNLKQLLFLVSFPILVPELMLILLSQSFSYTHSLILILCLSLLLTLLLILILLPIPTTCTYHLDTVQTMREKLELLPRNRALTGSYYPPLNLLISNWLGRDACESRKGSLV